ncbi:myosin-1-like [Linepithema humile]|uniref:myosin-1-like n=1 Tax=Linepithema humile TaxID=83485 RepID=UPI00351E332F
MGIMAIGQIIVLFALFFETFSAPSGCIESCDFHQTSYQSRHTSGGHHASLVEGSAHLNDHDYARPGNWTEHNQYNTDSGHGKVHEERGQYVEGAKRVRYYKKNFTSSYGNVNELGRELGELSGQRRYDSLHIPNNQHLESQAYNQLGQAVTKESGYNRLHSQQTQSLSTRIDSKSERLEDFGEYGGHSQVNQHELPSLDIQTSNRQHVETVPGNWSRVDSYKTDNGHGRVHEEEGQYVTGPKKVRYYKKNYTSSYSTSGVPQNSIGSATLDDLHGKLQRNLHEQLDNFRREFHQASSTGHTASATHVGSTDLTQETVGFHDLQTAESDNYRQQSDYRRVPSSGITHHYTDHQERETFVDTRQPSSHTYPAGSTGYDTQRTYQSHESRASRVHPTPHSGHSFPGYTQVPFTRGDQTNLHNVHVSEHHIDETQRAQEILGGHRSSVAQNQLAESSHRVYNPSSSYSAYPGRRDETRRYEEHWSSSSHTGGNVAPDFTHGHASGHADRAHYDRDAYNQQRGRYHAAQGYDSHAHTSESSYNTAYRTSSGQLVTGSLDLGQAARGADCTEETQQYQQETRYHRKYKRDDHHGKVQQHQTIDNEDLTQQNQELPQTIDDQQLEDLMQQSEQLTQQIEGQLEFGQQTVGDQHQKDLTQQTQESDDFTQQTSGKLEFGQQTVGDQHLEDLTQQNEQLTQQTEGQLEFGQHTVGHLEDLTQQNEQLTQQTEGQLEFGQHTVGHLEDLTQQSEQLTQQTEGQLEFGQQTVGDQHLEDLTQQSEQLAQQTQESDDFTQQTSGKLEFGQQTVDGQHLEDLTQQTQDSDEQKQIEQFQQHEMADSNIGDFAQTVGKLEYKQQNDDTQQLGHLVQQSPQQRRKSNDDFTQQTATQLEFGQQANQHFKDLTQQDEQFTQQTSDDSTQQINGELELGQQTQSINKYTKPKSQRLEEFNEDNEDLTKQTTVFNDFTQQTMGPGFEQVQSHRPSKPKVGNQHLEDFTQQNQDLTQHVGQFNDFTQQTTGNLEYGQQREQQRKPNWPEYNTQNSESQQNDWNLSQQSYQYPFHNNNEQWQLGEMSQKTDQDFMQQTDHDQQPTSGVIKPAPKPKPRQRLQKHDSIPSDARDFDLFNPIEVNSDSDIDDFHGRNIQDSSRLTDSSSNNPRSKIIYAQGGSVFDNEKENMDRLHWVHKSNDATVGLQWHYTYHPSDLTNVEGSHDNYYPQRNINSKPQQVDDVQQQSKSFDFNQQETQDKNTFQYMHENSHTFQPSASQAQHNKYDQQLGSIQQSESSYFDNQFNQDPKEAPSRVIPLQHNQNLQHTAELEKESIQTTEQTEHGIESRILQAYGGGPYDPSRNDDIYRRVRPNPSATLPPIIDEDPWDIREKPKEIIPWTVANTLPTTSTPKEETITEVIQTTTEASSFWNRLGHKITNTYDKAKEKAKEIFG